LNFFVWISRTQTYFGSSLSLRLGSNHGRADVLFEAAMYISNNTDVSLKDIAADDLELAAHRLIQGQLIGLIPPSKLKENSDDQ